MQYIDNPKDNFHPGPIMAENIIDFQDILLDTDPCKKYTNIKLKINLIENEDFIIVSSVMWKFIYEIYGGFEI